jgi:hypothetical protein
MCEIVIDEAMVKTGPNKGRFDRIFRRWFAKEDRQKVLGQYLHPFTAQCSKTDDLSQISSCPYLTTMVGCKATQN